MADISIFNDHLQDLELYKQKKMWCLFLPLSPPLSPDLCFSAERPEYKPTKNVVPPELEVGLLPHDNPSNSPASWPGFQKPIYHYLDPACVPLNMLFSRTFSGCLEGFSALTSRVGPQFGIAKFVNITIITIVYDTGDYI